MLMCLVPECCTGLQDIAIALFETRKRNNKGSSAGNKIPKGVPVSKGFQVRKDFAFQPRAPNVGSNSDKGTHGETSAKASSYNSNEGSRIILGWNDDLVDVMIMAQTNHVMHVQVNTRADHKTLFCSFVYVDNYYIDRCVLWTNWTGHAGLMRNRPWVLLGDFNTSLNLEDHSSSGYESNDAMREFKDCVQAMEVADVNSTGFHFTWNQKPKGSNGILKKIDRIMGNLQFNDDFPGSYTIFQPYHILDHSPCILRIPTFLGAEGVTNPLDDHDLFTRVLDNAKANFMVRNVSNDKDVVGGDITCAIRDFFSNGKLLKELNHTIISLIPKVTTLAHINDYWPISYCNVLNKCISKIISNRVKEGLGDIVIINQSAFVPGRWIFDNIILTEELMRNYHRRRGPTSNPSLVVVIMDALEEFKQVSNLVPSIPKSTTFFCNVPNAIKASILNSMPFTEWVLPVGEMKKGKERVIWDSVCMPKHEGDLELINGKSTFAWFDRWADVRPLKDMFSNKDIARSCFSLDGSINNLISDGVWRWPLDWLSRFPIMAQLQVPLLLDDIDDVILWRDRGGVWSKVRFLCSKDSIPPWLINVTTFITPISKGKTTVNILSRLVVAATLYYIWLERNGRLFKKTSSLDQFVEVILSMVRLKLVTFKFKKMSTRSCLLLDQWKILSYCIVRDGSSR
ncbi:reverse transcriptase domain, reverse transcriptase zinc-binding domain protein [Tanacetum coccineum]